jgi:hypothetical protein
MKQCSPGMILRKGYTIKNKNKKVKPACIKSQTASANALSSGLKRTQINAPIIKKMRQKCITRNKKYHTNHKCNVLFHLEKGTLSKFGYSMKNTQINRHKSLKKAIKSIKPLAIYRRLIALYILNKNRQPDNAKIFKNDAEWIKTIK